MTTPVWPATAHVVADGMRLSFRTAMRRLQFDDGMVRQYRTGRGVIRVADVECLVEGDAGRAAFETWLRALGPTGDVLFPLAPEGIARPCRIVGGRGGVRWVGMRYDSGRKWWRGALTLEHLWTDATTPTITIALADFTALRGARIIVPVAVTHSWGLDATLAVPDPPDDLVWDARTNSLTGVVAATLAEGDHDITVTATDASTGVSVSHTATMTVIAALPATVMGTLAGITVGSPGHGQSVYIESLP